MEIWVRKCSSFEEERQADREFWAQLTPNERVGVVEELRQHWARAHGTEQDFGRLQRCVRVLKRAR